MNWLTGWKKKIGIKVKKLLKKQTYVNLGIALQNLHRYSESLYFYNRALVIDNELWEAQNAKCDLFQYLSTFKMIIFSYSQIVEVYQDILFSEMI